MLTKNNGYKFAAIGFGVLVVIGLFFYMNRSGQDTVDQLSIAQKYNIAVGDPITVTGTIAADGDLRFYTHSIQTDMYGRLGLKSRSNLNAYKGLVQVQGSIDTIINDQQLFVINVESVVLLQETGMQQVDVVSAAQYIRPAGIHFPAAFFDLYDNLDIDADERKIAITQGDAIYTISYFRCTADRSDTDCLYLQNSFASTASKVFTTTDGMTFYKMSETDSRYTHNDGLLGYFFNDISETSLLALTRQIDFPTIKSVEQRVLPQATSLCTDGSVRIADIDDYTLGLKAGNIHLLLTGSVGTQVANCELVIDYTQSANAILTQFAIQELDQPEAIQPQPDTQGTASTPTTTAVRPMPFDVNVKQFPINLERPFVFTSSRGHTVTFPSQNIAFGAVEFDENPIIAGSACYAQQNLVSYANKPTLQSQPAIIIYECRRKLEDGLPQQYISYPLDEGRNFIVYVLDGARWDFANNISVGTN